MSCVRCDASAVALIRATVTSRWWRIAWWGSPPLEFAIFRSETSCADSSRFHLCAGSQRAGRVGQGRAEDLKQGDLPAPVALDLSVDGGIVARHRWQLVLEPSTRGRRPDACVRAVGGLFSGVCKSPSEVWPLVEDGICGEAEQLAYAVQRPLADAFAGAGNLLVGEQQSFDCVQCDVGGGLVGLLVKARDARENVTLSVTEVAAQCEQLPALVVG